MGLPALALFTSEEYLEFETKSKEKHEFYDGQIIAMAGASVRHMRIQTNLILALGNRFKANGRNCTPYASDARIFVERSKYFYPDVSVFCGKEITETWDSVANPEVVIEILSDSTASFDQNEKAAAYRQISSLKELVLIDSRVKTIAIFQKQADGAWLERIYDGAAAAVTIAGEEIPLDEIYRDVF